MKQPGLPMKRKMQHVAFRNTEEFLDYILPEELAIVEKLREIIFQAIPDVIEKLAYNVPFYKRHANICFIWPGSIPWGKTTQKGVRLGFNKGYLLEDELNHLDKGNRKEVYYRAFFSPEEISETILFTLLAQAVDADENLYRLKKGKKD